MLTTSLATCWCLLTVTQVLEISTLNITTSERNVALVPNFNNLDESLTFSGNSSSETLSKNTTALKVKQDQKTGEGNVTVMPYFFNPEENITFSGNSTLLIKRSPFSGVSIRSLHGKRRNKKRKYMISEFKASWLRAVQFCRSRDMELITINCDSDQKVLSRLLKKQHIKTAVWTSGSNNGGEKRFYWLSTGRRVEYKKWRRGQPDGMERGGNRGTDHCLQVTPEDGYDWSDFTCFTKQYFVCQTDV